MKQNIQSTLEKRLVQDQRTAIFCLILLPGQNQHCPRQNIFCPRLKSSYLLGIRIENYFKLWKTFFPWLKSYFPSISQAKMYFFSLGQKFLSGTKMFCLGQKLFCPGQKWFCPGRWTGHKSRFHCITAKKYLYSLDKKNELYNLWSYSIVSFWHSFSFTFSWSEEYSKQKVYMKACGLLRFRLVNLLCF